MNGNKEKPKTSDPNFYYCYDRFPQGSVCLILDLGMITNPKVGCVVKEKTNNLGKINNYSGRKFKLVLKQKQKFEDQDFIKYKNCYVRCYCNNSEVFHRELWVLHEDNK